MNVEMIPLASISLGEQPRQQIKDATVDEMAQSLVNVGQISPVAVVKTSEGYVLFAGHTRYHAAKKLGWKELLGRVFPENTSAKDIFTMSVVDNSMRTPLSFVEKADALIRYSREYNVPLKDAGEALGIDQSSVTKAIQPVERLTKPQLKTLLDNKVGGSIAYYISQGDEDERDYLIDQVVNHGWTRKKLETHFRQKRSAQAKVVFDVGHASVTVVIPKEATPDAILDALQKMAHAVKKNSHLPIPTLAMFLKSSVVA